MEIVTSDIVDPNRVYDRIQRNTAGSVVLHFAVVRGQTGEQITESIEFERQGDIEAELRSITSDARENYKIEDFLIIRRLGKLVVGEVMSLVAASAPHREDAFDACRLGVERMKKMKTVGKTER
ncbi:MAG: molybdenum cofactor biosynthesis protein MoaE [Dehalococcoidia bacterium]